jgi:hypothetical protein
MTSQLENKIIKSFISELGFMPSTIKLDGEYCTSDGYYCRVLNGKTIKKKHGLAWRLDLQD